MKFSIIVGIIIEYSWKCCGRGEIGRFEQFLLLSQCFQKSFAADASKCVYRCERVKNWSCLFIVSFCRPINNLSVKWFKYTPHPLKLCLWGHKDYSFITSHKSIKFIFIPLSNFTIWLTWTAGTSSSTFSCSDRDRRLLTISGTTVVTLFVTPLRNKSFITWTRGV